LRDRAWRLARFYRRLVGVGTAAGDVTRGSAAAFTGRLASFGRT